MEVEEAKRTFGDHGSGGKNDRIVAVVVVVEAEAK